MFKISTLTGRCALGAVALAAALSGCATYSHTTDAQITSAVEQSLATHPELGPPGGLQVETIHHVVYLNGVVYSDMQRDIANAAALTASNNAPIVNSIAVSGK